MVCLCTCIHTYPDSKERNRRGQQKWFVYGHVYTRIQKCMWMCMFVPVVAVYSEEGNVGNRKGCVCIHAYTKMHVDTYIRTWCGSIKGMSDNGRGVYIFVYTRIQKFMWMCMLVPGVAVYSEERERRKPQGVCMHMYTHVCKYPYGCV